VSDVKKQAAILALCLAARKGCSAPSTLVETDTNLLVATSCMLKTRRWDCAVPTPANLRVAATAPHPVDGQFAVSHMVVGSPLDTGMGANAAVFPHKFSHTLHSLWTLEWGPMLLWSHTQVLPPPCAPFGHWSGGPVRATVFPHKFSQHLALPSQCTTVVPLRLWQEHAEVCDTVGQVSQVQTVELPNAVCPNLPLLVWSNASKSVLVGLHGDGQSASSKNQSCSSRDLGAMTNAAAGGHPASEELLKKQCAMMPVADGCVIESPALFAHTLQAKTEIKKNPVAFVGCAHIA